MHYNIFQAQKSLQVLREAKKFPEIIWLLSLDQRFKLIAPRDKMKPKVEIAQDGLRFFFFYN